MGYGEPVPDRFSICLPYTLAQECPLPDNWSSPLNFSNNRHDPGGATMCGITQREYDLWRKGHSLPTQPVRQITQDEGYAIYRISYWNPHCPDLRIGLDLCFFDSAVNQGSTEAIRILQVALHVPNDGVWGPVTAGAAASITNVPATIQAFTARREEVYQESANFGYFGTDWMRRAQEIGTAAERAKVMLGHALSMYAKSIAP